MYRLIFETAQADYELERIVYYSFKASYESAKTSFESAKTSYKLCDSSKIIIYDTFKI